MLGLLNRKLLREIASSSTMILSIVLITMVGTACFVAMRAAHRNLSSSKDFYYARGRIADFWIGVKKLPRTELGRIRSVPGLTELEARIRYPVTVDLPNVPKPMAGLALSLPDFPRVTLNQIQIIRGGYFTLHRPNEVIVNDVFASSHRLAPGKTITLNFGRRKETLLIVGTAFSCEFVYPLGPAAIVPDREGFGIFYIKESFAEDVFDMQGAANELVGRVHSMSRVGIDAVLKEIERRIDEYGVITTIPLRDYPSNAFLSQEIEGLQTFAFIIPSIFLFVAAIIVNIVMIRRVEQQRVVIGTMKALGVSDFVIGFHILEYALFVGSAGGILGCLLGQWLSNSMTQIYKQFYEFPSLPSRWYPDLHLQAMVLAVLASGFGAWQGVRNALRMEPAVAMRPRPPLLGRRVFIEPAAIIWNRLSPTWRMAFRYLVRHPFRSGGSLLAGILATAVMSMILGLTAAISYLMVFHFEWVYRSDITIPLSREVPSSVCDEFRRLPAVRWTEPVFAVPVTLRFKEREKLTALTGLDPNCVLTRPRDQFGRPIAVPPTGFVLSRQLAKTLRVNLGDELEWRPARGYRQWYRSPVVAIAEDYVGTAVYASIEYLRRTLGEESTVTRVQISLDGDPSRQSEFFRHLKELASIEEILVHHDMKANLENTLLKNIWVILSIEILFAGTLYFGALLSPGVIAMEERQREFATLHALGYTPLQVGGLLAQEHFVILLAGLILGLPFGFLISSYVVSTYQSDILRMPLLFPPRVWLSTAFWGTVFAIASHGVVQLMIWRLPWLEAIKANE